MVKQAHELRALLDGIEDRFSAVLSPATPEKVTELTQAESRCRLESLQQDVYNMHEANMYRIRSMMDRCVL